MELAEKGDSLKLDITMKDIGAEGESSGGKKEDNKDDVYAMMEDMIPRPVFLWGKAVGGKLSGLHFSFASDNKKILLRERKRHTAAAYQVPHLLFYPGGGGTPSLDRGGPLKDTSFKQIPGHRRSQL